MSSLDIIHQAVRAALIKAGWIITDDPLTLKYADLTVFADLGAQRTVGAQRDKERIIVEIKSFAGPSPVYEFERALGQFLIYRALAGLLGMKRSIHLAVSTTAFLEFFSRESIQMVLKTYNVSLLVVDVDAQEVTEWIK